MKDGDSDDPLAFEKELVVRRPRLRTVAGVIPFALVMATFGFVVAPGRHGGDLAQLVFLVSAAIGGFVVRKPRIGMSRVRATEAGLDLGGELIPRARITSALRRHEHARSFVRFETGWLERVDVEVADEHEANAMLAALRLDALSATAELPVFRKSKTPQLAVGGALALLWLFLGLNLFGTATSWALALMPILMVLYLLGSHRIGKTKLLVGADGVRIPTLLGKDVFYKHDDIASVESHGVTIELRLKNGKSVSFDSVRAKQPKDDQIEGARSLVRRIEDARAANAQLASASDTALVLARGERTREAWVSWLRRLGEGADASFRQISTSREALLRTVESTRASAVDRIAAALALRGKLAPDEAPRLRVAAERCALPDLQQRLRVVLTSTSEEEAEQALAEAEAEAESGRLG